MISEDMIREITRLIFENYNPEKIILCGSYATGNPIFNFMRKIDGMTKRAESCSPAAKVSSA